MKTINLIRWDTGDQGTMGFLLSSDSLFTCFTIEPPWRDNQRNISCIPEGDYEGQLAQSRRYGKVYLISPIKGRTGILIHKGNLAGDASKEFHTHSQGCILLGSHYGHLQNPKGKMQKAILNSISTLRHFHEFMDGENFKLIVR